MLLDESTPPQPSPYSYEANGKRFSFLLVDSKVVSWWRLSGWLVWRLVSAWFLFLLGPSQVFLTLWSHVKAQVTPPPRRDRLTLGIFIPRLWGLRGKGFDGSFDATSEQRARFATAGLPPITTSRFLPSLTSTLFMIYGQPSPLLLR